MNAILNAILLSDLETRPGPSKVTLHWGSECVLKWLYVVILGLWCQSCNFSGEQSTRSRGMSKVGGPGLGVSVSVGCACYPTALACLDARISLNPSFE